MGRIKYNFTEEEMVQIYIDFSKKLGREYGASIDDFNGYSKKYGVPSFPIVIKEFKTLKNLRKRAGFKEYDVKKNKYNFTEKELVQIYLDFSRNLWKERKGTTALDIKKISQDFDIPSDVHLIRIFGTIENLRKKAGYVG